jgi:hypothetical protein
MASRSSLTFALLAGLAATLCGAASAEAQQCAEAQAGACIDRFGSISAVAWTGGGFTAIGVGDAALAVVSIDREGSVAGTRALELPGWADAASIRIDRVVSGPDGASLLVGSATQTGQVTQVGLIGRLDGEGAVEWGPPLSFSPQTSSIFYSGIHDPVRGRYMLVGRHTSGADDGSCTNWSQGLVLAIPDGDIQTGYMSGTLGVPAAGVDNRIAFYDIAPSGNEGEYVVTGFSTAALPGGGCQDNAVAIITAYNDQNGWTSGNSVVVGRPDQAEIGFALVPAGGRFLMAGYGMAEGSSARAAMVASVAFDGSQPQVRYDPYPEDGSDDSGGDRYRVLLPVSGGAFLVAGSASDGRGGRNHGIWRVIDAGLGSSGPVSYLTRETGSDILAAAAAPDGRVLGVGLHRTDDGSVGWAGIIHGALEMADRRPLDQSLLPLSEAELSAGSLEFSAREVAAGTGYRAGPVEAGARFEAIFPVANAGGFAVSAMSSEGDVDLMLLDAQDGVVAMSANQRDAGEYIHAELEPGDYRVIVLASSDVAEYELRIAAAESPEEEVIDTLMSLDGERRLMLDRLLAASGYGPTANAAIGFGSGAARSVMAMANTVQTALDAGAVAGFLASASGSAAP